MTGLIGDGLHHTFKHRVMLSDLTVTLSPGELVGLLGPNGAGKTTTFKILAGRLRPKKGRVLLDEADVTPWPLWRRARHGLAYVPQQSTVLPRLTVSENIDLGLHDTDVVQRAERRNSLLVEFGLTNIAHQKGKTLSGGERKRVELARVFGGRPRYLLVDEPFAGLDPIAIRGVSNALDALIRSGVGVLLTDHNVQQALEHCGRVYIIDGGKPIAEGTPEDIWQDKQVQTRYLGKGV